MRFSLSLDWLKPLILADDFCRLVQMLSAFLFLIMEGCAMMLVSISLIMLTGMSLGWICSKIKLPGLVGMLITGLILGPYALNVIDDSILNISSELRQIALIIILARAGLTLNINDLKKIGRPAFMMCFLPACFEIAGMMILAPKLLGISVQDAGIMGAVVGAVSPAVIVPRMIKLIEEGYGTDKSIPQLLLAGASVDDVFVIVVFSMFMGIEQGQSISIISFINIPVSIVMGIAIGGGLGFILAKYFKRIHMRDTVKVIIILSCAFLMVGLENMIDFDINFSALIAVMSMGMVLKLKRQEVAQRLSVKFNKLWIGSEIMLFVLVGAAVDINYAFEYGTAAVILIICVLIFRILGVGICLVGTELSKKERIFCMISYLPKATVQAAIGSIPLAMGLSCGDSVLAVAVLSILITAPLGSLLIDSTYKKLLTKT